MAKLNLYKIDQNKKSSFLENLEEKLELVNTKEKRNNDEIYNISLYNYFPENDKSLSWNWILSEFDKANVTYRANPRAAVTIVKGCEMYVVTFGSTYFLVDKFCDRKFAFEFAKRSEYKDIRTTALNAPNSERNKIINSFNNCSELLYESGQSYSKIKANMKMNEEEERFNGIIEIGTSIKFSMKENSLDNIIKIIEYVEETLKKGIIHKIPLFLEVRKDRVKELDEKLIESIKNRNAEIKFSEFDIIGVNETFNYNDSGFFIRYEGKEKYVEELDCEKITSFIDEMKIEKDNILDIEVEIVNDEFPKIKKIKEMIDFTDDSEKVVIANGVWYEYNDDYLKYLKESIEELEVEYEEKYDNFNEEYTAYIDCRYEEEKNTNSEYRDLSEDEAKKKIKKDLYKEKVFNILRAEKNGYENYDREIEKTDGNKYEIMDLYKDKTMIAVKIGNTSSKLCYAFEQSIIGMRMRKLNELTKDVEKVCVWLILDREKKLEEKNGKIDLNGLDMLMLKNRIDSWKKEVRLAGLKPIVKINYNN